MCDPVSIGMFVVAVAGAATAKAGQDRMISQQIETANNNTREAYRVGQENDRAVQAQAFEAQTDRMRKAAQEVSLARVLAAEGGGSLAARAININAGAAEDYSRIDASLGNQRASVQGQMAAAQVQNADAMAQAAAASSANSANFTASVANSAMDAGATGYKRKVAREDAMRKTQTAWFTSSSRSVAD